MFETERTRERKIESVVAKGFSEGGSVVRALTGNIIKKAQRDEETGEPGFLTEVWAGAKIKMAARLQQWIRPRR